jgi:hypothetical protein
MGTVSHSSADLSGLQSKKNAQLDIFQKCVGDCQQKNSDQISGTHQDSIKFNGFGFH